MELVSHTFIVESKLDVVNIPVSCGNHRTPVTLFEWHLIPTHNVKKEYRKESCHVTLIVWKWMGYGPFRPCQLWLDVYRIV
jgi:hypothetical protein